MSFVLFYYTYMKKLLFSLAAVCLAAFTSAQDAPLWLRHCAISPDGTTIAFTYKGDIYTVPVNIAGIPSLSLPCGTDSKGLPVGMQLIGKAFDEATLYRAGNAYETETGCYHISREEK